MSDKRIQELAEKFIAAWNTQEVDKVAACYSEDLVYTDPNLKGEITDQQALRRYLAKLFAAWKMSWSIKDVQAFKNMDGAAARWHATWQPAVGGKTVEADGMDFIAFKGDKVQRNEVYFDRMVIADLLKK
ncbi:MAG: nuclear transport factor 2 family protein [Dehalococcoidia bacterium]